MNKTSSSLILIAALTQLGTRQANKAKQAKNILTNALRQQNVKFEVKAFPTYIPIMQKASLTVDGKKVSCLGSGAVSGSITNNYNLISSLNTFFSTDDQPNINFNPVSDAISRPNLFTAPALSISRNDIGRLAKGKRIKGKLKVKKQKVEAYQVRAGNTTNPEIVVFSHFDSIGTGAIDNASGTACMLQVIIENPDLLATALFIFDGNEELSYDFPTYWGHGYRQFETKNTKLLEQARKIIVVDCVGYCPSVIEKSDYILNLAFPLKNLKRYQPKITLITGRLDELMKIYHSDADVSSLVKRKPFAQACGLLQQEIER